MDHGVYDSAHLLPDANYRHEAVGGEQRASANAGAGYADFPAIQQVLNYVGTPYDVVDVTAAPPLFLTAPATVTTRASSLPTAAITMTLVPGSRP